MRLNGSKNRATRTFEETRVQIAEHGIVLEPEDEPMYGFVPLGASLAPTPLHMRLKCTTDHGQSESMVTLQLYFGLEEAADDKLQMVELVYLSRQNHFHTRCVDGISPKGRALALHLGFDPNLLGTPVYATESAARRIRFGIIDYFSRAHAAEYPAWSRAARAFARMEQLLRQTGIYLVSEQPRRDQFILRGPLIGNPPLAISCGLFGNRAQDRAVASFCLDFRASQASSQDEAHPHSIELSLDGRTDCWSASINLPRDESRFRGVSLIKQLQAGEVKDYGSEEWATKRMIALIAYYQLALYQMQLR